MVVQRDQPTLAQPPAGVILSMNSPPVFADVGRTDGISRAVRPALNVKPQQTSEEQRTSQGGIPPCVLTDAAKAHLCSPSGSATPNRPVRTYRAGVVQYIVACKKPFLPEINGYCNDPGNGQETPPPLVVVRVESLTTTNVDADAQNGGIEPLT